MKVKKKLGSQKKIPYERKGNQMARGNIGIKAPRCRVPILVKLPNKGDS